MQLTGIGIAYFRGIGGTPVWLDLTRKVNILIGANNCGKSTVFHGLRFLRDNRGGTPAGTGRLLADTDRHQREPSCELVVYLRGRAGSDAKDATLRECFGERDFELAHDFGSERQVVANPFERVQFRPFSAAYQAWTNRYFTREIRPPELLQHHGELVQILAHDLLQQLPDVHMIPAIRQIKAGEGYQLDGQGIYKVLASWQHPDLGSEPLRERFDKLNTLLQRLLRESDVALEVPSGNNEIYVKRGRLRLPLSHYGTGIHELIILAIAVYSLAGVLFCVEEPEIHLHPLLQKEFLRFLVQDTNNRYVLSTHSHALMALGGDCGVVHMWQEDGVAKGRTVTTTAESLEVLRDLGIDASDLLQARSVIWVEGPSDRVYLNRWLELADESLTEGVDYSIMFYGGRLLSHLSLERERELPPEDLIALLRINQYSAILIDSDRVSARAHLAQTKLRVRNECGKAGVPCWITDGREIENYLPELLVTDVYAELTGERREVRLAPFEHLEDALQRTYGKRWLKKWSYNTAKVVMARRMVAKMTAEGMPKPLRRALRPIVDMIKRSR